MSERDTWLDSVVPIDLGDDNHRAGWKDNGDLYYAHRCKDRYQLSWCDVTTGTMHRLINREPLHIEASVLCTTCGDHGWIRDGKWVTA